MPVRRDTEEVDTVDRHPPPHRQLLHFSGDLVVRNRYQLWVYWKDVSFAEAIEG
jgi:hypothetical protein